MALFVCANGDTEIDFLKKILIIDDDIYIGDVLQETLTKEGYSVQRAYSGTEALMLLSGGKPDLVLLDLMLPGLSGEQVLPKIKGIPVIVLSAKVDVDSKVDLLMEGAVDYVTKPFNTNELLARIAVQLRAGRAMGNAPRLTYEELTLDTDTRIAKMGEQEIRLTKTEYAILKLLMQNPTRVITKSVMLDRISVDTCDCTESSLKTHISNLRKKLREAGGEGYIESVWGIGFKLKKE